jgi:hypothetical protein
MRFFYDNCVSPKLGRAVHALIEPEHLITHLRTRFPPATPDSEWIPALGREGGWIVISGDLRIRKKPLERDLWRAAKLTTFFMAEGYMNLPDWEQVRWMIDKWPLIMEQADRVTAGAAFLVPKRGQRLTAL